MTNQTKSYPHSTSLVPHLFHPCQGVPRRPLGPPLILPVGGPDSSVFRRFPFVVDSILSFSVLNRSPIYV